MAQWEPGGGTLVGLVEQAIVLRRHGGKRGGERVDGCCAAVRDCCSKVRRNNVGGAARLVFKDVTRPLWHPFLPAWPWERLCVPAFYCNCPPGAPLKHTLDCCQISTVGPPAPARRFHMELAAAPLGREIRPRYIATTP